MSEVTIKSVCRKIDFITDELLKLSDCKEKVDVISKLELLCVKLLIHLSSQDKDPDSILLDEKLKNECIDVLEKIKESTDNIIWSKISELYNELKSNKLNLKEIIERKPNLIKEKSIEHITEKPVEIKPQSLSYASLFNIEYAKLLNSLRQNKPPEGNNEKKRKLGNITQRINKPEAKRKLTFKGTF